MQKTKPAIATESALQTLAKGAELEKVVKDVSPQTSTAMVEMKDVTAEFLEPIQNSAGSLDASPFFVYKGITRKMASMNGDGSLVGVLAGKDDKVLDVIAGPSVSNILQNQCVLERWERLEYSAFGVVVWNHAGEPKQCSHHFEALNCSTKMLLICLPLPPDSRAWVVQPSGNDLSFSPVALHSPGGGNRKKNDVYTVMCASHVSTTVEDQDWCGDESMSQYCNVSQHKR